ncbi:MAG: sn-glycerol-3-phosphate ABC transporter ATP-binding protein UgpC [Betaproteobacteria bacterium]
MASVSLRSIAKRFGDQKVVHDIDLDVAHGEFVVLVGPSGCGKSTTLRMIAGLEDATSGEILIDGRVVNEVAPKDRDIAMVFQDYALYPHMSVYDNLAFGLQMKDVPKREIARRVQEAADVLGIEPLLERRPRQLSGGQRQRVAMGRAIVRRPKVFLFDEPLSNLDAQLRVQMRTEIKKLHRRVATTIVYVTHDQVEAMTLADRIVVMRGGEIEQVGTPDQVYNHPTTQFVGGFIGSPMMNFLRGTVDRGAPAVVLEDGLSMPIDGARLPRDGGDFIVGIRPEHFALADAAHPGFAVRADVVEPLGSDTLVFMRVGEADVVARLPPSLRVAAGDSLQVTVDAASMHFFDASSGKAVR